MATEQGSTQRRTQNKRLARAKIKHPTSEQEQGSKRGASSSTSRSSSSAGASKSTKPRSSAQAARIQGAQEKQERKDRAKKIGIAIFAVVMALSMMLPSLVTIVSNMNRGGEVQPATSDAGDDSATSDASSSASDASSSASATSDAASSASSDSADSATSDAASSSTASSDAATSDAVTSESATNDSATSESTSTVSTIDANYQTEVTALKKRLDSDPKNLAALLNLGNQYMSWGYSVSYYGGAEEGADKHAKDLFDQAISYYDSYLALNDSNAVKVDRALCQFYAGDYEKAQSALEKLTKDQPDYGPAWANLGMIYESMYNTEEAQEAYKKAAEADPENEYGAKSFANQRLAAINEGAVTESQDAVKPTTTNTTGLSQTLADASGTTF